MLLLQQPGPTSFVVQPQVAEGSTEKPKKYRVSFGGTLLYAADDPLSYCCGDREIAAAAAAAAGVGAAVPVNKNVKSVLNTGTGASFHALSLFLPYTTNCSMCRSQSDSCNNHCTYRDCCCTA